MVLIEKKRLILILCISFAAILISAAWAYTVGIHANQKGAAETVLFYGFILAGIHLLLSVYLLAHAHQKERELQKLVDILRYGGNINDKQFKKFGVLGDQMHNILRELLDLSGQKSIKIAGLSGLQKTLIEFIDSPLLLLTPDGTVIDMTKKAKTEIEFSDDLNIEDIFPDTDMNKVMHESDITHAPVTQGEIIFLPVFSVLGNIVYFLIDMSKKKEYDWFSLFHKKDISTESEKKDIDTAKKNKALFSFFKKNK
ncbi:hypothetical protein DWQ65_12430 [Treponema phagedenis]|uniref:Uncharacterized protein n=1 Tax=Treponema phagedenis TaxID=162 RepID=A0A0B7GYT5_TREPH|nr:hypothetical protein [Treponema phagedenis]EFW36363.1 hypothetical protein HMPREF9554_03171 [Treponema phagedenis F0421]QSH94749.1 hypothetical protein C5O78_06785 [Treponema phagedenis]QSI00851.1 hypothetical protein DWQ65_12430 [Treponema phagedenis]CEM61831.1 conserved membrane hypothetical protein [Treponema phagedenis]